MMTRYVTVKVTAKHIREQSHAYCPLELALVDAGYPDAAVGISTWEPVRAVSEQAPLSRGARRFVRSVDVDLDPKPATFRLPLPAGAMTETDS